MTIAASKIYLDDMHFYAYHGVMEQERLVGGEYSVSLAVEADLTEAVRTDDVADTINYAALYEIVTHKIRVLVNLVFKATLEFRRHTDDKTMWQHL